jgi:hypothetical protein
MKVITAEDGKTLRDFAANQAGFGTNEIKDNIAVFPESGLNAEEQANWLLQNKDRFDMVITFSPFIVSDALPQDLTVLDRVYQHTQGNSVNKITMNLWHSQTVGAIISQEIDKLKDQVSLIKTQEDIDALLSKTDHLGDSVEKHFLLTSIFNKEKQLTLEQKETDANVIKNKL